MLTIIYLIKQLWEQMERWMQIMTAPFDWFPLYAGYRAKHFIPHIFQYTLWNTHARSCLKGQTVAVNSSQQWQSVTDGTAVWVQAHLILSPKLMTSLHVTVLFRDFADHPLTVWQVFAKRWFSDARTAHVSSPCYTGTQQSDSTFGDLAMEPVGAEECTQKPWRQMPLPKKMTKQSTESWPNKM